MYDPPDLAELVSAVQDFLQHKAMPELEGRTAFHARVAVNALGIVSRQLEQGPAAEQAEAERLLALLGGEANRDLEAQNRELCRRIREGEIGLETPGLVDHLRATTLAKVAVDQPRYSQYRRALEQRS